LEGLKTVFPGFDGWFAKTTGARMHGHLFAPDRVQFYGDMPVYAGCLSDTAALRDYNPQAFLSNLVWNTRGETQAFHFGPEDRQEISGFIASDANALVIVITGAWALALHQSDLPFAEKRKRAAILQKTEADHLELLQDTFANVQLLTMTLESALRDPRRTLNAVLERHGARPGSDRIALPQLAPTAGLAAFLQDLKNYGLRLHLVGNVRDIPDDTPELTRSDLRKTGT
jgi:hypothetical protein